MTSPSSSQTDVLIIGAGPVGLTLAAELARHGVPGVPLLDTFAAERHATAAQLVAGTDRACHAAINPGPVAAFALRHLVPVLAPLETVQQHVRTLMSEFNVAYPDSALTEEHPGGHPHGDGPRAPDAPVSLGAGRVPGTLLDDVFRGTHWALLLFTGNGERAADVNACHRLAAAGRNAAESGVNLHAHLVFGAPVPDFEPPGDAVLDFTGALHARYRVGKSPALCLVRPDGYVGFRGDPGDAGRLDAYLKRFSCGISRP